MQWTEEQRRIIEWVKGPLLVIAVAGSGKTTVLLGRIKALIEARHAAPDDILLTTFSKRGAQDMAARAEELGVPGGVEYRTLHSVAYQMVRSAGHRATLKVPHAWQITKIVKDVLATLKAEGADTDDPGLKPGAILSQIGLAKAALIFPQAWRAADGQEL